MCFSEKRKEHCRSEVLYRTLNQDPILGPTLLPEGFLPEGEPGSLISGLSGLPEIATQRKRNTHVNTQIASYWVSRSVSSVEEPSPRLVLTYGTYFRSPGFSHQLCHSSAVWPWTSHSPDLKVTPNTVFLGLSHFILNLFKEV